MALRPELLDPLLDRLEPVLHEAVEAAGGMAMRFFREGGPTTARIWYKAGGSPVTEADVAVDSFLKVRLSAALPEAGWLSEETADDPRRLSREHVWIVDPIDGTRAFLSGSPDWSVAVALLVSGRPVLGIVHAPAHQACYAARLGRGATRDRAPIAVSSRTELDGARVSGPAPFLQRLSRAGYAVEAAPKIPSLALRIVRVADGTIDAGLVSGSARDWDIAGADLVLSEAGGLLVNADGSRPTFNRPDPVHGEMAAAPLTLRPALLDGMTARHRRDLG